MGGRKEPSDVPAKNDWREPGKELGDEAGRGLRKGSMAGR